MPDHMFLAFIAEMRDSSDAETVALAARMSDRDSVALALTSGSICCIAIARSVVVGIEPIEDRRSIVRFEAAFNAALALQ